MLYRRYIDEGITGTSISKRKNFVRMMEDAKDGHFDLIVTVPSRPVVHSELLSGGWRICGESIIPQLLSPVIISLQIL